MIAINADAVAIWDEEFGKEIKQTHEKTGVHPDTWRASGRATKANPDKENHPWWHENGPAFIQSYIDWRKTVTFKLWRTPAGEPAVELDLRCDFDGVPIRAIIDRVFVTPEGELVVVDIKSGANPPQDQGLQLGFYTSALEKVFGIRPSWAAYWNARKGALSTPYNVDHLTPEYLGGEVRQFVKARELGLFIAHPTSFCNSCGVRRACPMVRGSEARYYS